jgi:hypothetical protein
MLLFHFIKRVDSIIESFKFMPKSTSIVDSEWFSLPHLRSLRNQFYYLCRHKALESRRIKYQEYILNIKLIQE